MVISPAPALLVIGIAVAALAPLGAQRSYIKGLFVGTREGPVELIAWAEAAARGRLSMASGSIEDVPVVPNVMRVLCNLPLWRPVDVMVASHAIFSDERAERRHLRFATRPLNIYALEMRVADLERRATIERLFRSVRANDDRPGYVFLVLESSGLLRYYPFRIAAAPPKSQGSKRF